MPERLSNAINNNEGKKESYNKYWDDPTFKINVEGNSLSLRECYERAVKRAEEIHQNTKKIANEQIPEGKFILFVNAAKGGLVDNPEIDKIDRERLAMMYTEETGSPEIDSEGFQENNMKYCLGLEKDDKTMLKTFSVYDGGELPDLTNCVGIVFSGSAANIKNTAEEDRQMVDKMRDLANKAHYLNILMLGLCFGGQMLANFQGAEVHFVDEKNPDKRIVGLQKTFKTEHAKDHPIFEGNQEKEHHHVAQNHGQKIDKNTLSEYAKILLENENGDVDMLHIYNILITQFHPEVGSTRLDTGGSLYGIGEDEVKNIFENDPLEFRSIIFPYFLKMIGEKNLKKE